MDSGAAIPKSGHRIYKKVPPEGGWGYMVAISIFVILSLHYGPQGSFGILYVDFLESVGASTAAITSIHSFYNIAFSLSGLFSNALFKTFSCRQVGLIGAAIYCTGHFATIFIASVGQLFFTLGILPGLGYGLIVPAVFTCFNGYFTRKRATVLLASKPFVGIFFMCYPLLIYTLMEKYGFRGTLLVLAAISTHMVFAALTLQSSQKHQILQEIFPEAENGQGKPLISNDEQKDTPEGAASDFKNSSQLLENDNADITTRNTIKIEGFNTMKNKRKTLQKIVAFFDLKLLKDLSYVNLVIGMSFVEYSVIAFLTLLPLYLFTQGWTKAEASLCVSIMGAADIAAKIFLTGLSHFYPIKSRHIFLIGTIFTTFGRLISSERIAVFVVAALLGFFKPWIFAVLALIFAEHVPLKRFPAAYGLFMFSQGIIHMILGPVVGFIRDVTKSYFVCFHVLTAFLIIPCIIPWLTELTLKRMKEKKQRKNNEIQHIE